MNRKTILVSASILTLGACSLFAQMTTVEETTTTSTSSPVAASTTETTTTYAPGHVIIDSKGGEIGKVERVITRSSGAPRLVVVNTGERTVLVPPSILNVSNGTITYTGSTDVWQSAPVYAESTTYTTREAVAPIYKHYNVEMDVEEADD